jgi:hypothetical protein
MKKLSVSDAPLMPPGVKGVTWRHLASLSLCPSADWDDTFASRFRRSFLGQPTLPSVPELEQIIFVNGLFHINFETHHKQIFVQKRLSANAPLACKPKLKTMVQSLHVVAWYIHLYDIILHAVSLTLFVFLNIKLWTGWNSSRELEYLLSC